MSARVEGDYVYFGGDACRIILKDAKEKSYEKAPEQERLSNAQKTHMRLLTERKLAEM